MTYGNPILRKSAKSVDRITKEIKDLCEGMVQMMRTAKPRGVGLAAPQIGISLRIFIMEPEPNLLLFYANPEILKAEGKAIDFEGCLSVPGVNAKVFRAKKILISAINVKTGRKIRHEIEDFPARIFQHELDHLNGVIFTDYIHSIKQLEFQEDILIPPKLLERFKT